MLSDDTTRCLGTTDHDICPDRHKCKRWLALGVPTVGQYPVTRCLRDSLSAPCGYRIPADDEEDYAN